MPVVNMYDSWGSLQVPGRPAWLDLHDAGVISNEYMVSEDLPFFDRQVFLRCL